MYYTLCSVENLKTCSTLKRQFMKRRNNCTDRNFSLRHYIIKYNSSWAHCFLEDRLVARRFSRQFDRIFFCQMGPLLGVDPGLPFGLYFFPLTSEQLSIIYIKCQEHISEQFLFLLLFCFCWHWWSEGPICGTFLQESKSWSKLSPYHRFEGTSKTEIDQGFQKSWSHPRQSIL